MDTYTTRAHLAGVIGMLGLPPLDLIQRGRRGKEFFTEDGKRDYQVPFPSRMALRKPTNHFHHTGQWKQTDIPIPQDRSLESAEELLEGESKEKFLAFIRGMLQWRPEDRKTAKELLQDPWLTSF
jgi:serine/threonine protein kinase